MKRTLLFTFFVLAANTFAQNNHIRVIVDTSMSLHHNDSSGTIKTATALLYDLERQLMNPGDSFEVALFDPKWHGGSEPPESIGPRLRPGLGESARQQFLDGVLNVRYDSPFTYFSPCLKWAYQDLKTKGPRDQKTIVLLTDGLPDVAAMKADAARIRALVPQLKDCGVRVYVVAFGPEAKAAWFAETFGFGRPDGVTGKVLSSASSDHLLDNMLMVFADSFGYVRKNVTGQGRIDITNGTPRERAVVVALYNPGEMPGFQLTAPGGKPLTGESVVVQGIGDPKAHTKGHGVLNGVPYDWEAVPKVTGYAFQWLMAPARGSYGFQTTKGTPALVAVLSPRPMDNAIRGQSQDGR